MKSKLIYRKKICLATAIIFAAGCSLPLMPDPAPESAPEDFDQETEKGKEILQSHMG